MARILKAKSEELQEKAYDLSLRCLTCREIAKALGIDKNTASHMIGREAKRRRDLLSKEEQNEQLERSISVKRAVQRSAWKDNRLNAVLAAEIAIDKVLGLVVDREETRHVNKDGEDVAFAALMTAPVVIQLVDGRHPFDESPES
jgi:transposase